MLIVRIRSYLARHRAAHAAAVLAPAVVAALLVHGEARQLADDRAAWGDVRTVWLSTADVAPGEAVSASASELPVAAIPAAATSDDPSGRPALQRVARGEVITRFDVAGASAGSAALPADARTVAVPVDDHSLGVLPGDRVDVVAGGVTLANDGIVVAVAPGSVTIAVSASSAPLVAAAALDRTAALVGRPAPPPP